MVTDGKRARAGMCATLVACAVLSLPVPVRADPPGPPPTARLVAAMRPPARPAGLGRADLRCTADGAHCISLESYIPDVCQVIEATAAEAGLERDFFARLLWQESHYNASAVSPAGAQGIAQFMPGTAKLRALDDPFNPAKAMRFSARYLAELRDLYGNLGLAAAAYNAGEARVEDFIRRDRRLPLETRRYVPAITGYDVLAWKEAPPAAEDLKLALDAEKPFVEACMELARNRSLHGFRAPEDFMPWAVVLAAHRSRDVATLKYERVQRRHAFLDDYAVVFRRMHLPARHGRQHTAQIGAESRQTAHALCNRLRGRGVPCAVLRN